jgi:roadblock/LC7 domain-containing protein
MPRAFFRRFDYGLANFKPLVRRQCRSFIIRQPLWRRITGMSIVSELLAKPGVIAAGEYAYRGDRFSYRGGLTEEHARMASIMCRATSMGANMEGAMLESLRPGSGLHPARGWLVHGPGRTLCVMANVFCLLDNARASINDIVGFMRQALAGVNTDWI